MSDSGPEVKASKKTTAGLVLLVIVLAAGAVYVFARWFMPSKTPVVGHQPIWAEILASRWVIGAIRATGLAVMAYLVMSVIGRSMKGEWLSSIGPFKVGENVRAVIADRDRLIEELVVARADIAKLTTGYESALTLLAETDDDSLVGGGPDDDDGSDPEEEDEEEQEVAEERDPEDRH